MRQRFIQVNGELIPADGYIRPRPRTHMVAGDIKPYRSMETGEIISSRSRHREHLKRHGLIEVGNEIKAATTHSPKRLDRDQRRRQIADAINHR